MTGRFTFLLNYICSQNTHSLTIIIIIMAKALLLTIIPPITLSREHYLGEYIFHNKLSYPRARSAIPCFIEHSIQLFKIAR